MITVYVNGQKIDIEGDLSLLELLKRYEIGEQTRGVAVAVEEQVVLKTEWKHFMLQDGQKIEIVWARQGG